MFRFAQSGAKVEGREGRVLRRFAPILAAAAFLLLARAALPEDADTEPQHPDILFIFADDLAVDGVRSLGGDIVETPNLDRLAERGTVFTHAFNQGSWTGAVCVASRTMLNTGRSLWRAHALRPESEREAGRFWSEYLRRAGYRTYLTGKWHVAADPETAFDQVAHVRPGMPNQTPEGYGRPIEGEPDPWSPFDPRFGGYWKGGKHWSEVVADDAVSFLAEAEDDGKPSFFYVAFNAPHDPRQAPREWVEHYPVERIPLPRNWLAEYPYKDAIGCGEDLRDEKLGPFPRTEYAIRVHRREYYAIISHLDEEIGRILDALERSGRADRTWIFFTADHGLALGRHGLFGKQNLHDHSVRVPFLAVGPGVPAGRRIDAPIYLQDVMPTTLELAGLEVPEPVEFRSLLPLLRGETTAPPHAEPIYGAYLGLQRSIRTGRHKLLVYPQAKVVRLYDLEKDPLEMDDLASDPERQSLVRELFAKLRELQASHDDELDLAVTFPELAVAKDTPPAEPLDAGPPKAAGRR